MTPYCTVDDVQSLVPWSLPATSTSGNPNVITQETVSGDIIPEMSRHIDDRLAQFYVTPITGENALATVNRICRNLSAAEAITRKYVGETPAASPQATTYRQLAEDDLNRIVKGQIILYDAKTTGDTPESKSHQISDSLSGALAPCRHFETRMRF